MRSPIIENYGRLSPQTAHAGYGKVRIMLLNTYFSGVDVEVERLATFKKACDLVGNMVLNISVSGEEACVDLYVDLPENADVKAVWDQRELRNARLYSNPIKHKDISKMSVEEFVTFKAQTAEREQLKAEASVHDELYRSLAAKQVAAALQIIEANLPEDF